MFIKLEGKRVVLEHYVPEELPKEILDSGYIVTSEKPEPQGKNAILYYDVDKEEFYFEYSEPKDDPIDELKKSQIEQDTLIMSLLLGGDN